MIRGIRRSRKGFFLIMKILPNNLSTKRNEVHEPSSPDVTKCVTDPPPPPPMLPPPPPPPPPLLLVCRVG